MILTIAHVANAFTCQSATDSLTIATGTTDAWMLHRTCGRQEVLGTGEGSVMGGDVPSSSAIIRQDSPEEVRNQHPISSILPLLEDTVLDAN